MWTEKQPAIYFTVLLCIPCVDLTSTSIIGSTSAVVMQLLFSVMTTRKYPRPDAILCNDPEKDRSIGEKDNSKAGSDSGRQATSLPESIHDSEEQPGQYASRPRDLDPTDWTGPNDPGNPHNWGIWKRVYHATIPALFGFAV